MLTRADQESLHRYSSRHRELLAAASRAGCFYCGAIFSPTEIKDWVDGRQVETGSLDDAAGGAGRPGDHDAFGVGSAAARRR